MAVVSNSFTLVASLDGRTYYSQIVPIGDTNGFFQFLDKDTDTCSPTWNSTQGPKFYQKISDTDGNDPVPTAMPTLYWNGTAVTFTDGKSTGTYADYFACKQETVDDGYGKKTRWVFQIVKDLFSTNGNADSDSFYVVSQILDTSGNAINVPSEPQKVECILTTGVTGTYVSVTGNNIGKGKDDTTLTAVVWTPTGKVATPSGTWKKVLQGTDTVLSSGTDGYKIENTSSSSQLTVPKDEVDGSQLYTFTIKIDDADYTGWCLVVDLNDPYHAEFTEGHKLTNFVYGKIGKDDSVTYEGKVVDNDGNDVSGYTVKFYTRSRSGDQVEDGVKTFTVSYSDVIEKYKGELTGYITASKS